MKLDHKTLRAIGQDLERLGVSDMDLELEGERCVVRQVSDQDASGEAVSSSGSLKSLWKQFRGGKDQSPSDAQTGSLERVYLEEDIDRLEAQGKARRRDPGPSGDEPGRPDPHSISEMFRVVGVYCETAELELVSVSKRGERLKYDYLTQSEAREVEERAFSELQTFVDGLIKRRRDQES